MEPEALPDDPHALWWSAVVLAALHRVSGDSGCRLDPATQVVHLDRPGRGWLRLQRFRGDRFVLWGRSELAPAAPRDARRDAPDWARSAVTDDRRPTVVAWYAHGEWDVTDEDDEGLDLLLRPWLGVDGDLVRLARRGDLSPDVLATRVEATPEALAAAVLTAREATAPPPALSRGPVRLRLRDQVHAQMREAVDVDRLLLQQPPEVVAWGQVHAPRSPFEHAVVLRRERVEPAVTNTALPRAARRTLANVLRDLHRKEADEEHGAWLFARVWGDGTVTRFDRAFDHWPTWWRVAHPAQGPTLDDLAWEMSQRTPEWRPGWASLLPTEVRASSEG